MKANSVKQETAGQKNVTIPILIPYEPEAFWKEVRAIVKEELAGLQVKTLPVASMETPGLTDKPLYKMAEICSLFDVSKPTVYDWIKHGKLKPFKVRSRVYFLWKDIQEMMRGA